jgi:hypothetical protein
MTRQQLIEQILRQVYGGQPSDDSAITYNLVNQYINQGIGLAVKQNYKDSIQLDGVGYVNNSFYTTFKGLTITKDENFLWKIVLPEVPMGIGHNEGLANLRLKNSTKDISLDCLPLSINQKGYVQTMKNIPNKVLYYVEGSNALILSSLTLSQYTASVTLISGGDSTNLSSTLNVPADYIPVITNYAMQALMIERKQPQDQTNDGVSN